MGYSGCSREPSVGLPSNRGYPLRVAEGIAIQSVKLICITDNERRRSLAVKPYGKDVAVYEVECARCDSEVPKWLPEENTVSTKSIDDCLSPEQ